VKPLYLSSETVLPIKPFYLSNATCTATVKAAEETTAAFRRLKFSRKERARAAANPDALGDVEPSDGQVTAAVPVAVSRWGCLCTIVLF
jgi:hypothetical protein